MLSTNKHTSITNPFCWFSFLMKTFDTGKNLGKNPGKNTVFFTNENIR